MVASGPLGLVSLRCDALAAAMAESPSLLDNVLRGMARRLHTLDATI